MKKIFQSLLKQKKLHYFVFIFFILSAILTTYSWLQPLSTSSEEISNDVKINTIYDYEATIIPNILYPEGSTLKNEKKLLKAITNDIPFTITSTIISDQPVTVSGKYELQLKIKADDIWEKTFPIGEKQLFKKKGTDISIFNDDVYTLDYQMVQDFIEQVEEEISVQPEFYTLIIQPLAEGVIHYKDLSQHFKIQDQLIFQDYFQKIVLASEQKFTTSIPFKTPIITENTVHLFQFKIPINSLRIISIIFCTLFLVIYILLTKMFGTHKPIESEKIFRKYKNRLINISQKINKSNHSIINLKSFKALMQISDTKDLPIFYYSNHLDQNIVYFVIDEGHIFQFKLMENKRMNNLENPNEERESSYELD